MRTALGPLTALALLAGIAAPGCSRPAGPADLTPQEPAARPAAVPYLNMPHDGPDSAPPLLSQTGALADTTTATPNPALIPYELNVPFWSDGAQKRRWLALPPGKPIQLEAERSWGFPEGTVFVKHFELAGRRVETRLLVRAAKGGVYGVSYRWRTDQSEGDLVKEGRREMVVIDSGAGRQEPWYFPGPDDCLKCHLPVAGGVLGVNTRQLNRDGDGTAENQLLAWSRMGLFDRAVDAKKVARLPRLPRLDGVGVGPEERARAYLDANCAYCHRPGGAAADFDARYETPLPQQALIDAPARINLGIDRARQVAPNDPWRSMVLVRLTTLEQTRMPPLGHERIDRRGAAILREWIASLPGPPVVGPPTIEPSGGDFKDPVRVTICHPDQGAEVRYTLDGSPPGPSSARYEDPLRLTSSATVRARAFKAGHERSIVVQETFVIDD